MSDSSSYQEKMQSMYSTNANSNKDINANNKEQIDAHLTMEQASKAQESEENNHFYQSLKTEVADKELSQDDYERMLQEQNARTILEQEQELLRNEENSIVVKDEDDLEFEQDALLRRADPVRTNNVRSSFDLLVKKIEQLSGFKFDEAEVKPYDYESMRKQEAVEIASEIKQSKDEYFQDYLAHMRIEGHINENIVFKSKAFESDSYNRIACENCISFIQKIIAGTSEPLLQIICGKSGTGKTSLCHATANFFIQYRINLGSFKSEDRIRPWVIISSFDDIKKTWLFTSGETIEARNQREKLFDDYCKVKLLIIDGLCDDATALDGFSQRVLMNLLRTRAKSNLSILITTPYRPSELSQYVGAHVYECMKEFSAQASALFGPSRRHDIEDFTEIEKVRNIISSRNPEKGIDEFNAPSQVTQIEQEAVHANGNMEYMPNQQRTNNANMYMNNTNTQNSYTNMQNNRVYENGMGNVQGSYEQNNIFNQGNRAEYRNLEHSNNSQTEFKHSYQNQNSYNRPLMARDVYQSYRGHNNFTSNGHDNFNTNMQNRAQNFAQNNILNRAKKFNGDI